MKWPLCSKSIIENDDKNRDPQRWRDLVSIPTCHTNSILETLNLTLLIDLYKGCFLGPGNVQQLWLCHYAQRGSRSVFFQTY